MRKISYLEKGNEGDEQEIELIFLWPCMDIGSTHFPIPAEQWHLALYLPQNPEST